MTSSPARRDRRWRHRRSSVSGHRGGARAAGAAAGRAGDVCGNGARHRVAGGAARRASSSIVIRSGGLKGKSLADRAARRVARAARRCSMRWRIVSARRPRSGDRRRRLQLGSGRAGRGASRRPDDAARAERGAGSDQPAARAVRAGGGGDVRLDARRFSGRRRSSAVTRFGRSFSPRVGPDQEAARDEQASVTRVLVFGGSQGAHAINVAMVEAAPELAAGGPRLRLTHQTGERDVEMVRAGYRQAGLQADVEPFLYDMGRQLGHADLIVCRAGATTLAEIDGGGQGGDSVPLPTATDDHQRQERRGAGGGRRRASCCCSRTYRDAVLAERIAGARRRPGPPAANERGGAVAGAGRTRRASSSTGRWSWCS